jgi:hypothetical protein
MENFNKYGFLQDLKTVMQDAIEKGYLVHENEIYDYIHSEIDNACIYYRDCFLIAMELNLTDFEDFELGTAKNITQLAFNGLYEFVNDEFDRDEIIEMINAKNEEDENN